MVAPATASADFLAKLAHGRADGLLSALPRLSKLAVARLIVEELGRHLPRRA